jgi:hypothetical protein
LSSKPRPKKPSKRVREATPPEPEKTWTGMPQEISDVEVAFPAHAKRLMPPYESIPESYKMGDGWGAKLFRDMFYFGLKTVSFVPKEGIDSKTAFRNIRAVCGSFEPKHEHKEAAVAYMFELWFESAKWERGEPTK